MKKILPALLLLAFAFVSCSSEKIREPEYREIRDIRIVDVGLLKTTAKLNMVYYNPNSFGVQVSDASGELYIDDIHIGRFELDDQVQVKKRKEFVVPTLVKLNNLNALANHKEIINKKKAKVRIEGLARIKKTGFIKEVPIKYEGIQDIEKLKDLIPIK